ncbi:reverse transcriptase domain, reverse transcriptase zinc-binding domain protein [Tanacetum coccineum]
MGRGFLGRSVAAHGNAVVVESFPTMETTFGVDGANLELNSASTCNATMTTHSGVNPGISSYVNVTGEPSRKALNFCSLFTPAGNGVDVIVPVESIRAISERFANTAYGFFLGKRVAYLAVANYIRNTWGKYGLVKSMLNSSTGIFSFQFSSMDGLDVMLENGPWSSYARALIEVRANVELKDNIMVAMPKLVGEGFYMCIVHVEYEWKPPMCAYYKVSKRKNINTSGNKKKDVEPTKEVSNSNPFVVLKSVENDVDLVTNGWSLNLASKKANSSRSMFWNVESSNTSTTPIVEKFDKIQRLIIDGKVTLVNDEGKPLTKVGYGTNILLEQWKETYENDDCDFNPYDDDMYEGQDILDKI